MSLADMLDQTCDIYLQASVIDATGGPVRDPRSALRLAVPCLERPMGGSSDNIHDRAAQTSRSRVYFDERLDLDLDRRHALLIGDRVLMIQSSTDYNKYGQLVAYDCQEVVQ